MKRLLIISSLYPEKNKSMQGIFVEKQVMELAKHFEVKVLATKAKKGKNYTITNNNIEVQYLFYSFPFTIISAFFYYAAVKTKLRKLLSEFNPEFIHIHDYKHYPELYVLRHLLNFRKYRVFLTLHNDKLLLNKKMMTYPFYRFLLKYTLPHFPHIITVSGKVKKILQDELPSLDNITVIGNGTNEDLPEVSKLRLNNYLPDNKTAFNIISVGNLVKTKGFDILIKAVKNLLPKYNLTLTIIGEGYERMFLEKLVQEYNIEMKVRLLGKVDYDIVLNLYSYYDAFVLPSWSETFGIVYLEAMLAGIPVIGIKGEGIDGIIINGVNGFLAEPQSVPSVEEKIELLLNMEDLTEITNAAQETVSKNHLLTHVIEKLNKMYLSSENETNL